MHLERSFEHLLDEGGLRRATLQGTENLTKRYKIAAACFNLSLLMRTSWELEPQNNGWQGPIVCLRTSLLIFAGELYSFFPFAPGPRHSSLFFDPLQNAGLSMKPGGSSTVC